MTFGIQHMNWKRIVQAKLCMTLCILATSGVLLEAAWGQDIFQLHYSVAATGPVSAAGDVNADGYDDVIVGGNGQAVVRSGLDGIILFTFNEVRQDYGREQFGSSVSGAGDVNNDGYADVIVGAPGRHTSSNLQGTWRRQEGVARVFSGRDGSLVYTFSGDSPQGRFGSAVSAAGDVNADGYDDVIVGAYSDNLWGMSIGSYSPGIGSARVFSGKDGSLLYKFIGDSVNDNFGTSVADAGDMNADGYDDVIVGAPNDDNTGDDSGSARVFSGKDGSILYTFDGEDPYQWGQNRLGTSVAGAGDVNGDGYADVIVGALTRYPQDNGSAKIFSGKDGRQLLTFAGEAREQLGSSVSKAGDVNADGYDDVIVGCRAEMAEKAAMVRVFSGKNGQVIHSFSGPSASFSLQIVAGVGDVNGDGLADVVIGSNNGLYLFTSRDTCPDDPSKLSPGQCGCGTPDTDSDNDGIADCNENKPPTDIALSAQTIFENAGSNAVVGIFSTTDSDNGDAFNYSLVAGAGDGDNAAFNISGDTLRATNSFDYEVKSSYSVRVRSTDREGLSVEKIFVINVENEPELVSVLINGADSYTLPGQRSQVTSIVVTTDLPLTNAASAFSLSDIGLFVPNTFQLPGSQILVQQAGNVCTLRFANGPGVVTRVGQGNRGNSLADGNWVLTVSQNQISGKNTFGTQRTQNFYRMFGDSDGDSDVDGSDVFAFRRAQDPTTYNAAMDWDGNGAVVSGVDSLNFGSNVNKRRRAF